MHRPSIPPLAATEIININSVRVALLPASVGFDELGSGLSEALRLDRSITFQPQIQQG